MALVPVPGKPARERLLAEGKEAISFASRIWNVIRRQNQQGEMLEKQSEEIAVLKQRVAALEARERELMARAEADATRAAAQTVADLARRIGHLEAARDFRRS